MNAIKNYSSNIPINRIFERIQKTLSSHGARQIIFDYGNDGKIYGLSFVVPIKTGMLPVKLPSKVDKAAAILKNQYHQGLIRDRKVLEPEQAYRVAWRNLYDWVDAQMALLDIDMVKMEEVFFPYVVNNKGETMFEMFESNPNRLLQSP